MDYAIRPATEFNKYDTLDLLETLQNTARDSTDEKHEYYRLAYQTVRGKVHLPPEYFRSLVLRLLGDKDHQKVFEAVAKVEKTMLKMSPPATPPYRRTTSPYGQYRGDSRRTNSGPRCYHCNQPGHRRARCFLRKSQLKPPQLNGSRTNTQDAPQ